MRNNARLPLYEYLNKKVIILGSTKPSYRSYPLKYQSGEVVKLSNHELGIRVHNVDNPNSQYNIFWFKPSEIKLLYIEEKKDMVEIVGDYSKVARVKLLNETSSKLYDFRLYDEDAIVNCLVVVNPRNKDNRVLGEIREIIDAKDYNGIPTAEVVAVVDEAPFFQRQAEVEKRRQSIIRKSQLEQEISKRIDKLQKVEMFEAIAQKYSDVDPELMTLVQELKSLEKSVD